jgi:hypothetical protein
VTERVVVGLEAVEVEEQQRAGVLGGVDERLFEVVHEPPAVGEPTQPVGQRLRVAAVQEHDVLTEGQGAARHRGQQTGGGERAGERGQVGDPPVEQEGERDDGAPGRNQDRHAMAAHLAGAPRLPGGDAHGQHARRPEGVDDRPVRVDAGVLDVAVDRVADRGQHEAEREQRPCAPGAPARDAQSDADRAEEQQVPGGIGERHGNRQRLPLGGVQDRPEQQRGHQRRERQAADRAIQPQRGAEAPQARTQEQHEPDVGERIGRQIQDVGDVRIRRVVELVVVQRPGQVGRRPHGEARGQERPRAALCRHGERARGAHRDPAPHEEVVDPVREPRVAADSCDGVQPVCEHAHDQDPDEDVAQPPAARSRTHTESVRPGGRSLY